MSIPDVTASVHVSADPQAAFQAFVHGIDRWWPKENTFGAQAAEAVVIEPEPGGVWYERDAAGTCTPWGDVLAVEPGQRLGLTWGIGPDRVPWQPEPDKARRSTLWISFESAGDGGTWVTVRHTDLARHGAHAQDMADAMASPYGWRNLLNAYKTVCESA